VKSKTGNAGAGEDRCHEALETLRRVIGQMPHPVEVFDPEGTVVMANRHFLDLFGLDSEEGIVGSHNVLRDSPLRKIGLIGEVKRAFEGESVFIPEVTLPPMPIDGEHREEVPEERICELSMYPLFKEPDKICYVIGSWRDVTHRKRAEDELKEREEKYRQLFESETDAIILLDAETRRIIDANEAACRTYGYSREEMLSHKATDISAEPDRSEESIERTRVEKHDHVELRYHRKKDGTVFPVEVSAGAFTLQGRQVICGIFRNITERKRAEEDLKRACEDMERQNVELLKLDELKDALIRDVTHELRTPVAKQAMQIEMLRWFLAEKGLTGETAKFFEVLEAGVKRQESVIRNILTLSRLESGGRRYKKEPLRIDELLEEVLEDHSQALASYDFEVQTKLLPEMVHSDPEMLWHVFSNILNNAVKYRNKEYRPRIRIAVRKADGELQITLTDNGVGMSEEEVERSFERFYQASTSAEGIGVGLTISRMIVEGLGGRILMESPGLGRGATAVVSLPRPEKMEEEGS
jgi:PAS domain S-box-containing protein